MLLQRIEADRDIARRENRKEDTAFYSYLIAKAREPGKSDKVAPRDSTDEEIVAILRKLIRENDETLALQTGQGEERLRQQNKLLTTYLPEQLSAEELITLIEAFITGQNWTDEPISPKMMGPVMSMLKEAHPGRYDPAMASRVARTLLLAHSTNNP